MIRLIRLIRQQMMTFIWTMWYFESSEFVRCSFEMWNVSIFVKSNHKCWANIQPFNDHGKWNLSIIECSLDWNDSYCNLGCFMKRKYLICFDVEITGIFASPSFKCCCQIHNHFKISEFYMQSIWNECDSLSQSTKFDWHTAVLLKIID